MAGLVRGGWSWTAPAPAVALVLRDWPRASCSLAALASAWRGWLSVLACGCNQSRRIAQEQHFLRNGWGVLLGKRAPPPKAGTLTPLQEAACSTLSKAISGAESCSTGLVDLRSVQNVLDVDGGCALELASRYMPNLPKVSVRLPLLRRFPAQVLGAGGQTTLASWRGQGKMSG